MLRRRQRRLAEGHRAQRRGSGRSARRQVALLGADFLNKGRHVTGARSCHDPRGHPVLSRGGPRENALALPVRGPPDPHIVKRRTAAAASSGGTGRMRTRKYQIITILERVNNRLTRFALRQGLEPPAFALLEMTGRRSGQTATHPRSAMAWPATPSGSWPRTANRPPCVAATRRRSRLWPEQVLSVLAVGRRRKAIGFAGWPCAGGRGRRLDDAVRAGSAAVKAA
jgi:hypothetical protein